MISTQERVALYPGTFDPMTYGHVDIVHRASRLFEKVIVAVAANEGKSPLFSHKERIELAKNVLDGLPGVEVLGFNCLLTKLSDDLGVSVILRGLRAISDFEYEFQLAMMNRHMVKDFETIFLTPSEQHMFTSSTMIREIARYQGDVSPFVPAVVAQALQRKFGDKK